MIDNATGSMNECLTGLGYGMACRGLNGESTSSPSSNATFVEEVCRALTRGAGAAPLTANNRSRSLSVLSAGMGVGIKRNRSSKFVISLDAVLMSLYPLVWGRGRCCIEHRNCSYQGVIVCIVCMHKLARYIPFQNCCRVVLKFPAALETHPRPHTRVRTQTRR